jgi:hypothetical protein
MQSLHVDEVLRKRMSKAARNFAIHELCNAAKHCAAWRRFLRIELFDDSPIAQRGTVKGSGFSTIGRALAAGEVVKGRPIELPRVEFIDRRLRVGERAAGNAEEVDRAV